MHWKILLVIILISFGALISCTNNENETSKIDLSTLSEVVPEEISRFDNLGDIYLSHLGYKSIGLDSNRVIIADRENPMIILTNIDGDLIKKIREGRGPGEVLDAYEFVKTNDNKIYINDNGNKKVIVVDNRLNFITEFKPQSLEGTSIVNVYPGVGSKFLFELTSFDFLQNKEKEREKVLVQYDLSKEEYGKKITIKDRPYARTYLDGRLVGARQVPYSDIALTSYNQDKRSLFVYETSKSQIIEINSEFDTLNTISIKLPTEELSDSEIDSLKEGRRSEQWKTMSSFLPSFKSEAESFIYYNNHFWIQSNLRGNYQKWFLLDINGKILKTVKLPKNVIITHITKDNIGVRLDDSTFGLFESAE
jgi:hypothetical protein